MQAQAQAQQAESGERWKTLIIVVMVTVTVMAVQISNVKNAVESSMCLCVYKRWHLRNVAVHLAHNSSSCIGLLL